MYAKIQNRDSTLPSDGWYVIETFGEHVNRDARVVQIIDIRAVDSMVEDFMSQAGSEMFPGIPVGKDHLNNLDSHPTEALGWVKQLRRSTQGLEANIGWTVLGLPYVECPPGVPPVYKFFSTEYVPANCENVGSRNIGGAKYQLLRPTELAGLSLTNEPNNRGQKPIGNRANRSGSAPATASSASVQARTAELRAAMPHRTFADCWGQAQREIDGYQSTGGGAEQDSAQRITDRAMALKAKSPQRTFSDCWNAAMQEVFRRDAE